ncbi:MAG: DUF2891 domain-containing protein [Olegusella sp.]|nr:DUF2891 domain-containing protein [Olegusella sp.]
MGGSAPSLASKDSDVGLLNQVAHNLYGDDVEAPVAYEPDSDAFFSPILNEAMLISHVLAEGQFDRWLKRFLPQLADPAWRGLKPVPKPQNGADYLQAHQSRLP